MKIRKSSIWIALIALVPILPKYFGLEISGTLPVLTASRIIVLYLIFKCLLNRTFLKRQMNFLNINNLNFAWVLYILADLVLIFISSDSMSAFKDLFNIVLDEFLFIVVVLNLIDSEDKLERLLESVIFIGVLVSIGGIIEAVVGYNFWDNFYTISRQITNAADVRLGTARIAFSFQHSIYFGMYSNLMLPLLFYKVKNGGGLFYKIGVLLNICCTFLTISRGSIAVCAFIIVMNLLDMRGVERKRFRSTFLIAIIGVVVISYLNPSFLDMANSAIKAVLNELGFNFDVTDFGSNSAGLESRTFQMELYGRYLKNNWLTGLGGSASDIYVSVDNGYLGWLIDGGIIKFFSKCILLATEFMIIMKNRKNDKYAKALMYSLTGYLLALIGAPENVTLIMWNLIFVILLCRLGLAREECCNI